MCHIKLWAWKSQATEIQPLSSIQSHGAFHSADIGEYSIIRRHISGPMNYQAKKLYINERKC